MLSHLQHNSISVPAPIGRSFAMGLLAALPAAAPYQRHIPCIALTLFRVEGVYRLPKQLSGLALAVNRAVISLKPIPCNTYTS